MQRWFKMQTKQYMEQIVVTPYIQVAYISHNYEELDRK